MENLSDAPPPPSSISTPSVNVSSDLNITIDISLLILLLSLAESLARLSFHIPHRRICRFWCNRKPLARFILFVSIMIDWFKDVFAPIYVRFMRPTLYEHHPVWLGFASVLFLWILVRVSWRKVRRLITQDRVVTLRCAMIEAELLQEQVG